MAEGVSAHIKSDDVQRNSFICNLLGFIDVSKSNGFLKSSMKSGIFL